MMGLAMFILRQEPVMVPVFYSGPSSVPDVKSVYVTTSYGFANKTLVRTVVRGNTRRANTDGASSKHVRQVPGYFEGKQNSASIYVDTVMPTKTAVRQG